MYWVIRWTDEQSDADMATVIEAETRDGAELAAREQGIPYVLIARACQSDLAAARAATAPRRTGCERRAERTADRPAHPGAAAEAGFRPHTCLGRPLGRAQLATFLLAGVATAMLHLRPMLPAIMS